MFLSTFWLNRHARQTRGGPVCPPVSMISFDFGKTTAKMTFLQWNHDTTPFASKSLTVLSSQLFFDKIALTIKARTAASIPTTKTITVSVFERKRETIPNTSKEKPPESSINPTLLAKL